MHVTKVPVLINKFLQGVSGLTSIQIGRFSDRLGEDAELILDTQPEQYTYTELLLYSHSRSIIIAINDKFSDIG